MYNNFNSSLKHLILGPWSGESEVYYDPLYFSQYSFVPMTDAQLPPMPSARKRPRTEATFITSMQFCFKINKLYLFLT